MSREYDVSELSQNFGKVMFQTPLIVNVNTAVVMLFPTIVPKELDGNYLFHKCGRPNNLASI
jgi:hypothetical protein